MADMVKMDLRQDYRDADGRLYRKGKGRQVPAALAAKIGKVRSGASSSSASSGAAPQASGAQSSGAASSTPSSSTPSSGSGADDAIGTEFPAAGILAEAGITSRAALAAMSDEELLALDGIGDARLAQIRDALKEPAKGKK